MSVRIYQLSKEIGLDNNQLIDLLKKRGHDVKSASSTVDNISAQALREEYKHLMPPEGVPVAPSESAEHAEPPSSGEPIEVVPGAATPVEPVPAEPPPAESPAEIPPPVGSPAQPPVAIPPLAAPPLPAPVAASGEPPASAVALLEVPPPLPKPNIPMGAVVRSKEEIEKERRERQESQRRPVFMPAAKVVAPPPVPGRLGAAVVAAPGSSAAQPKAWQSPSQSARPPGAPVLTPPPLGPRPPQAPSSRPPSVAGPTMAHPSGMDVVRPLRPPSSAPTVHGPNPAAPVVRPPPSPVAPPSAVSPAVPPATRPVAPAPAVAPGSPAPGMARAPLSPAPAAPPPMAPPMALPPRSSGPSGPATMSPPRLGAAPPVSAPPSVTAPPVIPPGSAPDSMAVAEPPAGDEPRVVQVRPPIVVREFAILLGIKPFKLIAELHEYNIFASLNQVLEPEVAQKVALKHGLTLKIHHRGEQAVAAPAPKKEAKPAPEEKLEPRPPVVCILGHVDHGKTTLLDTIRQANVAAGEPGGITQHIGAYQVEHNGHKISFIDTPGHAAFSSMRARGANVTDIAILVVAADDGFMPQTDEALGHARLAKVPIIVAINKIDAPGANVDKVFRQMQERGIAPEDWGGETLYAKVSALKGLNIPGLLDTILLQAEIMELKANYKAAAEGVIIETQKETGLGATASVIVLRGTLKTGDSLVCGAHYCKVRQILSDSGKQLKEATPATPVKIVGWSGTPDAGYRFLSVKNDREAKRIAEENELEEKKAAQAAVIKEDKPSDVASLLAAIAQSRGKVFKVLVKADVFGTAEALAVSLLQVKSEKIKLEVVDTGVGAVTRSDVSMAQAAGAAIVAFDINFDTGVAAFAKHHNIAVYRHNIIYELIDLVKDAMADQLDPELRENKLGAAEVRQVFPVAKGFVAGCLVTEGRITRSGRARLLRKGQLVAESGIDTLRRFKDDASEVRAGYECGIRLANQDEYLPGDIIECFEIQKLKASL